MPRLPAPLPALCATQGRAGQRRRGTERQRGRWTKIPRPKIYPSVKQFHSMNSKQRAAPRCSCVPHALALALAHARRGVSLFHSGSCKTADWMGWDIGMGWTGSWTCTHTAAAQHQQRHPSGLVRACPVLFPRSQAAFLAFSVSICYISSSKVKNRQPQSREMEKIQVFFRCGDSLSTT